MNSFPFLPLSAIRNWEPLMRAEGVSEVARSPRGFLTAFKKAKGDPRRLSEAWLRKRVGFIKRHWAQAAGREPWFDDGGLPTRRHLALIAWAFSPVPGRI